MLAALFCCGAMIMTSCNDDDDAAPEKEDAVSYLDRLKADYEMVTARFPDAAGHFVEAQYVLNGKISDTDAKDLKVAEVTYVYNLGWDEDLRESMIIYHERDFEEGSTPMIFMYNSHTPWMGDKWITGFDGFISLEEAIEAVRNSEYGAPETAYVTLRYPVIEFDRGNALYVFGGSPDRTEHYFVDAVKGDVIVIED